MFIMWSIIHIATSAMRTGNSSISIPVELVDIYLDSCYIERTIQLICTNTFGFGARSSR